MKIYYLHNISRVIGIFLTTLLFPLFSYTNNYSFLKKTKDRPDLQVQYFQTNLNLWTTNHRYQLSFSESLTKTGRYRESMLFGYMLLLKPLNFFDRGRNYFNIAQNHYALGNITKSRYYLDKILSRNNQYYLFYYARVEEYETNYSKSINLYHKAFLHKSGKKNYINSAYSGALHKALIFYKNRDRALYDKYLMIIKNNPCLSRGQTRIIQNALIL